MLGKIVALALGGAILYYAITEYGIPQYYQYRDYMWYGLAAYALLAAYSIASPQRRSVW
jgi:hypothetical protein